MTPGEHTITARAYNTNGQYAERTSRLAVTRFDTPFIGASDAVSLDGTQSEVSDVQIWLKDASLAETPYDVHLEWRTATQGFEIVDVD